jgi:hypothetical protein
MRNDLRRLLRRIAWVIGSTIFVLAALLALRAAYAFRDRNPGFSLSLDIDGHTDVSAVKPLRVGFGRVKINPDLNRGPVYLAGFSQNRTATAIHDDLWAVACVIDDGRTRLGIVSLDAIGLFHDDVLSVRRMFSPASGIDYAVVCSTHNHSTPDLLGLWGPDYLHTGVDADYRRQVIAAAAHALDWAAAALRPVRAAFHEIALPPDNLVEDGRKPEVYDPGIRIMHFTDPSGGATIGSLVTWANHPETLWSRNTEITSDYCGYLRAALEEGVVHDGRVFETGVGGVHMYVNGAIGGLMTTSPDVTVRDPYSGLEHKKPSHEKARAVAHQLVSRILPALRVGRDTGAEMVPISVSARTVEVVIDNWGYLLAQILGLLDRGHVRWKRIRTEVAVLRVGDAGVACVPGEIYPELVNGGAERAPGGDFDLDPVEVPPIRDMMPGRVKFVFGLANDEIGYMIPLSEWDENPPYLYGSPRRVYGEINSCGPYTARVIHQTLRDLCR